MQKKPTLTIHAEPYAVCRLPADAAVPAWIENQPLVSMTRTPDELSIVCDQNRVPDHFEVEKDWALLQVVGPLDFAMTGIIASLTTPLAQAGIPVFVFSTFDTDYLMVKQVHLATTIDILSTFCEVLS